MDKYIRMLLLKLSQRYKVTITNIMYVSEDTGRIGTSFNIRIAEKRKAEDEREKVISEHRCRSKRDLVNYMANYSGGG